MAEIKTAQTTATVQSAVAQKTNTQVAPRQEKMKDLINSAQVKDMFRNAMQEHADSFLASVIDLYNNDKALQACAPNEVLMEAFKAATLKLPINKQLGFAYVLPYNDRKLGKTIPTFQMGYKGLIQLAMRTGAYKHINAGPVFEGELKSTNKLTGEIDLSGDKVSEKVLGYFAYIETVNGFSKTMYWDINKMISHAKKYSKAFNFGPWQSDFDAMAAKTMLRNLIGHYGIMSVEMQTAYVGEAAHEADLMLTEAPASRDITPEAEPVDVLPVSDIDMTDGMNNITMDDLPPVLQ